MLVLAGTYMFYTILRNNALGFSSTVLRAILFRDVWGRLTNLVYVH
jgi:hypothetical protein